jgi:hypothetical protein
MRKKLQKMDLREVSLKVRVGIDNLKSGDLRLIALLGFFHRSFLKLVKMMQIPLDTDVLNTVIGDYIQEDITESENKTLQSTLEGISLLDLFQYFLIFLDSTSDPVHLMYLYGFSQGILNRIMRKLGIDYQIPPLFPL